VLPSAIRSLIALTLLLGPSVAAADPTPMATGSIPAPARSTTIALAREELQIDVNRREARVAAVLWLENAGPATRLEVGFPCDAGLDPGIAGLDCKTRIAVLVDGKKVKPALRRTAGKTRHWMWPMRFAEGQTVKLEVTYASRLRNDRYKTPFLGMGTLYYRLATGASWAGPIGELTMQVDLPVDALVHISPPGYTREHGRITWKLEAYEPTEDLAIIVHPMFLGKAAHALPAENRADMVAAIASGKVNRDAIRRVAHQMREELPELLRFASFFHRVALAKLGLPEPTPPGVQACVEESIALMEKAADAGR
jgi:hypothetical protein